MGAIDAFMATWSNARQTLGEGTPQEGAPFDNSNQLRQMQSAVQSATPGDRWTGPGADSYADANSKQSAALGQMAGLDQRLGAEVDRSATVVNAARQNLDSVKQWVLDASSAVPPGPDSEQQLLPIARKGIGDVVDVIKQTNGDLNSIGGRIRDIGNEYRDLGDDKKGRGPEGKIQTVVGQRKDDSGPWEYPVDPPAPSSSAPGGGRWDIDNQHPYPPGPGGGPPMGPMSPPKPWSREIQPPIAGPSSGFQNIVDPPPNGWGADPPLTVQEAYKFRLTGEHFDGSPDHVRWVQRDGSWYQAKWIDYDLQAEHITRPAYHGVELPIGLNHWQPMSIHDIYAAQAHNPRLTMYVPDSCGQPFVISSKTPSASRG